MSKRVRFLENPVLVRRISDRTNERIINTQTPNELRLAMDSYYKEAPDIIDKQQKEKKIRKKIPISSRVTSAIRKGMEEASQLRREEIAQKYDYAYWWLGGNKQRKQKKQRKTRKNIY